LLSPSFLRSFCRGFWLLPCCAFAAAIVAQLLVGLRVVRRALFGADAASASRNLAVEWRLEPVSARLVEPPASSSTRLFGRWSLRGLAFAAAIEAAIVLGVAYGLLEHAGHRTAHSAHARHADVGDETTGIDHGMLHRAQSASSSGASTSHD
jgi:hypothetical protein